MTPPKRKSAKRDPLYRLLGLSAAHWRLLKWTLMLCAVLWTLIFQLGESSQDLPEFVYVNF